MLGLTTFRLPDRFSRLIRLPSGSRYRNKKDTCHQTRCNLNHLHSPTGYCEGEDEGEDTEPLKDRKPQGICRLLDFSHVSIKEKGNERKKDKQKQKNKKEEAEKTKL